MAGAVQRLLPPQTLVGMDQPCPQRAAASEPSTILRPMPCINRPRRRPPCRSRQTKDSSGECMSTVDVTILMPCLNEELTLPQCIKTAHEAGAMMGDLGLTYEILISDNGSTDTSVYLADSLGCRVVNCPDRGYGNALVFGLKQAAGT